MLKRLILNFKKLNASLQTIIFVGTVVVLFAVIVSLSLSIVQMRHQLFKQEQIVIEYENESKVLVEKLEKTSTESYIEETARTKYGMVKTGETPVEVTEQKAVVTPEKETIGIQEKTALYLKEWYLKLNDWFTTSDRGEK